MLNKFIISPQESVFIIIDIQDKLARVMSEKERVVKNTQHLIEISRLLKIPLIVTEQYPEGLGETVKEIRDFLPEYNPVRKITFDCCDEGIFLMRLEEISRKNIIITGMETHICVLQTCISLLKRDYNVHIVSDGVCSRSVENKLTGLEMMKEAGAVITCTETVLFQLLKKAGTEEFRIISKRIK